MGKHRTNLWNLDLLFQTPEVYSCTEMDDGGIRAIFYEGQAYQGHPTHVFAYYGLPEKGLNGKIPAIVLVHGGGGTAFKEWIRIWTKRGYAAIAMDLEGHVPANKNENGEWPVHRLRGPARQGVFADYTGPLQDQWMYHAAADVMLAHSFLRSLPDIDLERTGIHGISWGGIVTSLIAGIDHRFAFAIPVYGCGYLYEADNQYGQSFRRMPAPDAERVKQHWDPSAYFSQVTMPMLWLTWSNDPHFPLLLFSKSFEASRHDERSMLSIHFGLGHSHANGWKRKEIYAFADQIALGKQTLTKLVHMEEEEGWLHVKYDAVVDVNDAKIYYAVERSDWFSVEWFSLSAYVQGSTQWIRARIPLDSQAYFLQIIDARGCVMSTPIRLPNHP
ncbi:S9 family peptidase [Paenibacillus sp. XY044]|uniref:alpha/beta hydrolase family protein n=1 Tax=Paenibacillus sp. XY044 TaxID=2026089 RepID=UPI000B992073|nr:prolyl oligopeptidase family serine peptidase [Paenibacillus sp. XY044]OZB95035.1 hypothetical protein CJP46_15135 [Paenibacillus sp. XY044]